MVELSIAWDNPSKIFSVGDFLTGSVQIFNSCGFELEFGQDSVIVFSGVGIVKWRALTGNGVDEAGRPHYPFYRDFLNDEVYFQKNIPITFFNNVGRSVNVIPSGSSAFPFRIRLPIGLPSSCKVKYGQIQYRADISLFLVNPTRVQTMSETFYVNAIKDLRGDPVAEQYSECHMQISDSSESVNQALPGVDLADILVRIPKRGFIAGETICFYVKITNDTRFELKVCFSIIQTEKYSADGTVFRTEVTRKVIHGPYVSPRKYIDWFNEEHQLPECIVDSGLSTIVTVSYHIKVEVTAYGRARFFTHRRVCARSEEIGIIVGSHATNSVYNSQSPTAPPNEEFLPPLTAPTAPAEEYDEDSESDTVRFASETRTSGPLIQIDEAPPYTPPEPPPTYDEAIALASSRRSSFVCHPDRFASLTRKWNEYGSL